MIDNFPQIRPLLTFPNENSFYFLEVIKRRKENPEMARHAETIKDFYITSLESFENQYNKVKGYCDRFNARAYLRLNVRDAKQVALQCNKRLSEILITEDWKALKRMHASVVGEFNSATKETKTWVIDLDGEGEDLAYLVTDVVLAIDKVTGGNPDIVVAKLPTKNGVHLITKPFRLDVFRGECPNVDVHKDNPTILYVP